MYHGGLPLTGDISKLQWQLFVYFYSVQEACLCKINTFWGLKYNVIQKLLKMMERRLMEQGEKKKDV